MNYSPCVLLVLALLSASWGAVLERPLVKVWAPTCSVGMGRTLSVQARAVLRSGVPAAGWQLLPYVNGRRWGSHETSDAQGRARFLLPLPTPGQATIHVVARAPITLPEEHWIWTPGPMDPGTVYLQRVFILPDGPAAGALWVAVDDLCRVFLNGVQVAEKGGWRENAPVALGPQVLRPGENVLSVAATNGGGPAGVLVRLTVKTGDRETAIVSNSDWRAFTEQPPGWPGEAAGGGAPAAEWGTAATGVVEPDPWPTLQRDFLLTGSPMPEHAAVSNPLTVTVCRRPLRVPPTNPDQLICVQWEPWFTPLNANWRTGPGVPVMGLYQSFLREVHRQLLIWFMESGINTILADWSNHIWFARSWSEIGPNCWEIINATTLMMDEMAAMRQEGYPVPKMTLLIGVSHVLPEGPGVVNEQLQYIWDSYIANPKYQGLWQYFDGKPLVEVLDLGASYLKAGFQLDDRFTIRYVGVAQDVSGTNELGLWTWMDWKRPVPTFSAGRVEALTVSVASFGPEGWTGEGARGRRGGATLVEDWHAAMELRPRFLHLHQFNEFAGQPEGHGHGPERNRYYDSYSAELSDDFEPTSLTAPAYRSKGGWGFFYLNLVRALVDLYRQPKPETTVVVISDPSPAPPGHSLIPVVRRSRVPLKWVTVGRPAAGYTVSVDGNVVAQGLTDTEYTLDLRGRRDGMVRVRVTAEGTRSRYRLLRTEDSLPLARPEPAWVEMTFYLDRARRPTS